MTGLARLLSDSALRRGFARDRGALATELRIRSSDRPVFLQLSLEDLEFQAGILLRKRFEPIQTLIPLTLSSLPENGWPLFRKYASVAGRKDCSPQDAFDFLLFLKENGAAVNSSERSRIELLRSSKRFALKLSRGVLSSGLRRTLISLHVRAKTRGRVHLWRIDLGI